MYKHSPTLASAAISGFALHLNGTGAAWTIVLSTTVLAASTSLARIAIDLGAPHPGTLLQTLRGRFAIGNLCPHCGRAHA
jgi:hypothetical protein